MEYVYGALLLNAAGKPIDEKGLTSVLSAAGVTPDAAQVKAMIASLDGVNLADVLAKSEMVAAAPAAAPAPAAEKGAKGEKKEEEKKEEKGVSEEEAAEGLSALFG
ncbi:MAG: 50S ribosomal protein P1 [Candidatus Thermoplasmatota archaeon]|jgi:large subunit ribosomal protein L12|nr:50S ribosomal protein P1 [Candidatus Thermoplasmatota archaeon]